jgi:topoisomerase IA-like protein
MSTLNERLWAVLSERGREAAGLTYDEAAVLVRELRASGSANGGKISGLCIVTARAAEHVAPAKKAVKAKGKRQKARGKSGD